MTGPVLRRTTRRHLNGTVETVEELAIGDMPSEPLTVTAWAELYGISRNTMGQMLPLLGGEAIGEGNARRWRLPLSAVPLRYFGGRCPSLLKFARQADHTAAGGGTIGA